MTTQATPSDWRRELESLPRTWPKPLKDQVADPVARTAVRRAYEAGAPVTEICRRTGRSPDAVRLMLSLEGVLRAPGARGYRTRLPPGYRSWAAYVRAVVHRRLADGTYRAEWPLPPHRTLAGELGVGPEVVYKVVRQLRDEGRLRREGRRLVVTGANPPSPSPHAQPRGRSPPTTGRVPPNRHTHVRGCPALIFPSDALNTDHRKPVTRFAVLDETRRHPDLAEQISAILHTVAPIVTETTGLTVPPDVRFRLITPKQWRTAFRYNAGRILTRDIADLEMTPKEITQMRRVLKIGGIVPVVIWPLIAGVTMEATDGQTETVIAPRTLQHSGYDTSPQCLAQIVAHELVHHAQLAARTDAWEETLFPDRRGRDRLAGPTVLEGHATWADHKITAHLYGTPVNAAQHAKRSRRFRLHAAIARLTRLSLPLSHYEQGFRLIARAVDANGTDMVNQVWTDASLLPTTEEITDPDTWARRLAAAPAQQN
ncbi:zinc-dependent metalloprotease [Streptomyces sp. 4F14]|uniref:zinc-dependent metalloprotease n=1 Tax=Streptomyces sp. 4F14 TaxID=3394380 RepID=UPI003A87C9E7